MVDGGGKTELKKNNIWEVIINQKSKIINKKTGEEIRYTQVKEYDYVNDETDLCFDWQPNTPFQKGNYDVEIYNKGHLAGKGNFVLK